MGVSDRCIPVGTSLYRVRREWLDQFTVNGETKEVERPEDDGDSSWESTAIIHWRGRLISQVVAWGAAGGSAISTAIWECFADQEGAEAWAYQWQEEVLGKAPLGLWRYTGTDLYDWLCRAGYAPPFPHQNGE